jgi:signal transduction histidine kinase
MIKLRQRFSRHLDLQAKIVLVLLAVVVPTFLIVTLAQNQLTKPILEDEIRQIGENSGKRLAAEIVSDRLLQLPKPTPVIEKRVQEVLDSQPNIVRVDVIAKDITGVGKLVASNIEEDPEDPEVPPAHFEVVEQVVSDYKIDDAGAGFWEINVPIDQKSRDPRSARRVLGSVHVVISAKIVSRIAQTVWKMTAAAAGFSMFALLVGLGYFLRKTIQNDRRLREAESQNLQLTEQLHEAERQLMNTEKLAVMGQLTASFAHEIGTPLTAIGGHLQLLKDDLTPSTLVEPPQSTDSTSVTSSVDERVDIINGQLMKIEGIVKSFLQSTAKPTSQTQLVDLNQLSDKTIRIVKPRMEALGVDVRRSFDRAMGPVRVVPLDLEQILLNLLNNSLDSIGSKKDRGTPVLEVGTETTTEGGKTWAELSVYDTGEGIKKLDLKNVLKPFFTTKPPGEGTGLGLAICDQLAHKYGGHLEIDSREGVWTRVTLKIPYQVGA